MGELKQSATRTRAGVGRDGSSDAVLHPHMQGACWARRAACCIPRRGPGALPRRTPEEWRRARTGGCAAPCLAGVCTGLGFTFLEDGGGSDNSSNFSTLSSRRGRGGGDELPGRATARGEEWGRLRGRCEPAAGPWRERRRNWAQLALVRGGRLCYAVRFSRRRPWAAGALSAEWTFEPAQGPLCQGCRAAACASARRRALLNRTGSLEGPPSAPSQPGRHPRHGSREPGRPGRDPGGRGVSQGDSKEPLQSFLGWKRCFCRVPHGHAE